MSYSFCDKHIFYNSNEHYLWDRVDENWVLYLNILSNRISLPKNILLKHKWLDSTVK